MSKFNIYADLIRKIKGDFKFSTNWNKITKKKILLRHDIDFSIENAYLMAKKEKAMGVKATYFFMISNNFYNIFSFHNKNLVLKIKKLGHKISLHFDPTVYKSINIGAKKEIKVFENLFNVKLDIISIHRPRDFLINNNRSLAGRAHTYQDKFIKNKIIYISDSGGKNIVKKVKKLILNEKPIQLLIHPIWWINNLGNVNKTLNSFLIKKKFFLKKEIAINCKTYRS